MTHERVLIARLLNELPGLCIANIGNMLAALSRAGLAIVPTSDIPSAEERAVLEAAETALASARELLAQWLRSFPHLRSARLGVRTEEWLTSHPAPVAVLPPISESDSG